jgi:hypothetical protein
MMTMDEDAATIDECENKISGLSCAGHTVETPRNGVSPPMLLSPPRLNRCTYHTIEMEYPNGLSGVEEPERSATLNVISEVFVNLLNSHSSTFVVDDDSLGTMEDEDNSNDEIYGVQYGTSTFRPIRSGTERYTTPDRPSPMINLRPRPRSSLPQTFSSWTAW